MRQKYSLVLRHDYRDLKLGWTDVGKEEEASHIYDN
jgi:hypothetical protein